MDSLVLSECMVLGRPTRDCLFSDVVGDGRLALSATRALRDAGYQPTRLLAMSGTDKTRTAVRDCLRAWYGMPGTDAAAAYARAMRCPVLTWCTVVQGAHWDRATRKNVLVRPLSAYAYLLRSSSTKSRGKGLSVRIEYAATRIFIVLSVLNAGHAATRIS
eukprot:2033201-Rhodomonas_salina.3